jgi:hypothetical protein
MSEYYAGKGCKCCSQSDSDCCCEVDWTDPEVYKLREIESIMDKANGSRVSKLEAELAQLTRENDNLRSKEWSNKFQPEEVIE